MIQDVAEKQGNTMQKLYVMHLLLVTDVWDWLYETGMGDGGMSR